MDLLGGTPTILGPGMLVLQLFFKSFTSSPTDGKEKWRTHTYHLQSRAKSVTCPLPHSPLARTISIAPSQL